eukprot:jgi/Astpho2/8009/fgenesh1_pg.00120_%23_6_t
MASKLPAAKKYQRWVFSEVLPSIHKTGKYAINSEDALIDAFDASRIATGNSKNNMQVLYYGDIGVHDGEHLLKFGCSDNIRKRVLHGHKKAFQQFTLQRAFSAMNNREVESRFKEDVDIQKQRVSRTINGKKQTELLVLNNDFTTKDLDTIIHRIIAKNPPGLMDNLKRHLDTEDKEVKLARLETDAKFNMRRLELESHTRLWRRPQAEKDMKRMEMKHELDMIKLKHQMSLSSNKGRTFASSPDDNMSDVESSGDDEPVVTACYADMVAEHLPTILVFKPDAILVPQGLPELPELPVLTPCSKRMRSADTSFDDETKQLKKPRLEAHSPATPERHEHRVFHSVDLELMAIEWDPPKISFKDATRLWKDLIRQQIQARTTHVVMDCPRLVDVNDLMMVDEKYRSIMAQELQNLSGDAATVLSEEIAILINSGTVPTPSLPLTAQARQIMDSSLGPYPVSGSFSANGGGMIFTCSGSFFVSASSSNPQYFHFQIDGSVVSTCGVGIPNAEQVGTYENCDIVNTPSFSVVATSGRYADLKGLPQFSTLAYTANYTDIVNSPVLAAVATSGRYSDLVGAPALGQLAAVATSGKHSVLIFFEVFWRHFNRRISGCGWFKYLERCGINRWRPDNGFEVCHIFDQ